MAIVASLATAGITGNTVKFGKEKIYTTSETDTLLKTKLSEIEVANMFLKCDKFSGTLNPTGAEYPFDVSYTCNEICTKKNKVCKSGIVPKTGKIIGCGNYSEGTALVVSCLCC